MKMLLKIILCYLISNSISFAQGNILSRAKNFHSGNKVRTTFYNYGLVGRNTSEPDDIGGEWPINSGHEYIGDVGHLVGSEFKDQSGTLKKSVVTIESPRGSEYNLDTHWGWEPIPGYTNPDTPLVAMSHMGPDEDDPDYIHTWPNQWPDKLDDPLDPGWAGSWNGYFGKNQKNAEQESYFIMDDYNDAEFDYYPDSMDFERRGMGLTCQIRGLQWNHILAEDVLFWLYDIKNISDHDIEKMVFGYIVGTITGGDGDSQDDWADFEKIDDIAFSYDNGTDLETGLGGVGATGWSPVGLAGYAFLESPGNPYDGIDNDGDGSDGSGEMLTTDVFEPVSYSTGDTIVVIDYNTYERSLITFPSDSLIIDKNGTLTTIKPGETLEEIPRNLMDDNLNGLIDENNGASIEVTSGFFEDFYLYLEPELGTGLKYINYRTGSGLDNTLIDESRGDGIDNDGDWDPTTDDVGLDGLAGSGDLGENDGIPTSGFGTDLPGEPNIDKTDIDESDQIGLSSFYYFNYGVGPQMNDDNRLWEEMLPGYFNNSIQNTDADFLFSSGYFPLQKDQTERFSVALLFGDNLPDLIRNKQTVQTIYNQNYNFAKAPDLPRVWAYAGDGYVTLYWDDAAEFSQDRITGEDFEGYKIYKATDTEWTDAGTVTDAFGSPKFNVPIKQYDLDNEHEDFFPGHVDGIQFYLGDNSGLVHTWTDTNVINGHQYFYAVTAYDHGSEEKEILPAETSKFITMDRGGNVSSAKNVISIIPDAPSLGYIPPPESKDIYSITDPSHGTGTMNVKSLDPSKMVNGNIYQIYFKDSRTNGVDDDNDWVADSHDVGIDGCLDLYENGDGGCQSDENVDQDPNNDNWQDCGSDGLCDENETGYNELTNPDPNGDNYDYQSNPFGTESNNQYDFGEGTESNERPDSGEPNIDHLDPDELPRNTTHITVINTTQYPEIDTVVLWTNDLEGDLIQFDGMLIEIKNDTSVNLNKDLSLFSPATSRDYSFTCTPFSFGGYTTKGIAYPRNLALVFSDSLEFSSKSLIIKRTNGQTTEIPSMDTHFKIIDLNNDSIELDFAYLDQTKEYYGMDPNLIADSLFNESFYFNPDDFEYYEILDTVIGTWNDFTFSPSSFFGQDTAIKIRFAQPGYFSYSDRIIIMEDNLDTSFVTWAVTPGHDSLANQNIPGTGDTLKLLFSKPFSSDDIYEFVTTGASHDLSKMRGDLKKIKVVPNPYIVGASWEGQNPYADGRGPRALHFNHLPPNSMIRIFTMSGELVNTLEHRSSFDNGTYSWDMLTKDNLDIAYGVYFFHVEPLQNSEEKFEPVIGKFAIIK